MANKQQKHFTIIDIQFTGASPRRDYIVELSLIKHDGNAIIDHFHTLINPEKKLSDFLLALFHLSANALEKAPTFLEIATQVADFTKGTILVGLNIRRIYALLKKEMKQAEQTLQLKHICISQLIEENFSVQHPKTLSSVCKDLQIPFNAKNGLKEKTTALAAIFEQLFLKKHTEINNSVLHNIAMATKYPIHLPREKIEDLPRAVGVYYFLNHKGQIIYLGKSKNIRQRILSHFNTDLQSSKKQKMKANIYDVQYKLTGSELTALLLESDEIKRFMPTFNRAQRRKKYRFGLYLSVNEEGYKNLTISTIKLNQYPLIKFTSQWKATSFLLYNAAHYGLRLDLCGIPTFEKWFSNSGFEEEDFIMEKEEVGSYNEKVNNFIQAYSYIYPNMLIVENGRSETEYSVVLIANNHYQGYGYLPSEVLEEFEKNLQIASILSYIIPFRDNPDVQNIIRSYLKKQEKSNKHLKLIQFSET